MKLDILVIAAHPDDAELGCGGTILSHVAQGKKVGVVDLTAGELGTRGSAELRAQEAAAASKILGLSVRENLGFRDGFFQNDEKHQLDVVRVIRRFQPEVVIANAIRDRHPDHGKAAELTSVACFLAGLRRIETRESDLHIDLQQPWRPAQVLHFIQSDYIKPDIVVDISPYWEQKLKSVLAYGSQFHNPEHAEKEQTFISTPEFLKFLEGRAHEMGQSIRVRYGEGFTVERQLGVKSLFDLI